MTIFSSWLLVWKRSRKRSRKSNFESCSPWNAHFKYQNSSVPSLQNHRGIEKCCALSSARRTSLLARIVSCKSSHELSQRADVGAHLSADSMGSNRAKSKMCEGSWQPAPPLWWPWVVSFSPSFWCGSRCQVVLQALCWVNWLFLTPLTCC